MVENTGNPVVAVALFGFIPFVKALFQRFNVRLAIASAFVAGWMFLPVAGFKVKGIPSYNKVTASCLVILFWARKFDRERLEEFTFSPVDLPMVLWCISPFFSSVFNDLGLYDGLSQTMYQSITWGVPYYIGRVWFNDTQALQLLGMAIFIGAIAYIPFCWVELIMSPQLHRLTYGFHQHDFLQTLRDGGGFRPMVYMDHGLMTATWMGLALFLGAWLFHTGDLPEKIVMVPSSYLLMALAVTFLMMKSYGAIFLVFLGILFIFLSNRMKNVLLILILLLVPLLYAYTRTTGIWDGTNLSSLVSEKLSPTRAQSLQFRFDNEAILIRKAVDGTVFGWGGYGRSRVYDKTGKDISVTDGLWIITLGQNGIFGLTSLLIAIQTPVFFYLLRIGTEKWNQKNWGAPTVMAVFLSLYMIDSLLNAMINPVYMLFSGGIVGMLLKAENAWSGETETMIPIHPGMVMPKTRFIPAPSLEGSSRFIS
ncbi:MAG: hypothetical protein HGA97_01740 [Chlorobiaceae bacterium]|nr:hypothetical protein [Chlorobiaceae bacterium]